MAEGQGITTSIQAAIQAAQPGDTIQICPARFTEQLSITNPLTLVSLQEMSPITFPPASITTFSSLN